MSNKAKDFPTTPFRGRAPEHEGSADQAKRRDGTTNTHPRERMRRENG